MKTNRKLTTLLCTLACLGVFTLTSYGTNAAVTVSTPAPTVELVKAQTTPVEEAKAEAKEACKQATCEDCKKLGHECPACAACRMKEKVEEKKALTPETSVPSSSPAAEATASTIQ